MNTLSTHILDTALGKPAAGVAVRLERRQADDWIALAERRTDEDGRIADLASGALIAGHYRLTAAIGAWFHAARRETLYVNAQIEFILPADGGHYHLPFVISPWSWSTYRGS